MAPSSPAATAYRIYATPEQPLSAVALLVSPLPLWLYDYDGWDSAKVSILKSVSAFALMADRTEYAILPGTRTMRFVYNNQYFVSLQPVQAAPFKAQAGNRYVAFYTLSPIEGGESVDDSNILFLEPFAVGDYERLDDGPFKGQTHRQYRLSLLPRIFDITETASLAKIVTEQPDWLIRRQALAFCDDKELLQRVASTDADRRVRLAAADRLYAVEGCRPKRSPQVFDDYDMTKAGVTAADIVTLAVKPQGISKRNPFAVGMTSAKNNGELRIETVDGLWHPTWRDASVLKFLPGEHTVRVAFEFTPVSGQAMAPGAAADLAFTLTAGHSYTLAYVHTRQLRQGLGWQNELKLTITDDATKEVVCQL